MKRLLTTFVVAAGCALASWAETPATLTTLHAVHSLSNAQASAKLPVAFEATVTDFSSYEKLLFVQDGDEAIFVSSPLDAKAAPGDRVLVRGATQESFRPIVVASSVSVLNHGALPKPIRTDFDALIHLRFDAMFVTIRAVVRAADIVLNSAAPVSNISLQLVSGGGRIEADVDSGDQSALEGLLGAEVEITGAEAGDFDDKMQPIGLKLHVPSLAFIKVLKRAPASPWSLPVMPMDRLLQAYRVHDLSERVRVHGIITYYEPGSAIVLQDGSKSVWINTHTRNPLQIGDDADATGYPDAHNFLSTLNDGEVKDSLVQAPVTPLAATWRQLAFWNINKPDGHQFDLVSIEGKVVTEVREAALDEYVLATDEKLFTAIYRHPPFAAGQLASMVHIPLGSTIRVTGICMTVDPNPSRKGQEVPFDILLRSFKDIEVVKDPSLLSIRDLILLVGLLLVAVALVGARGWAIEHRTRRQTASLAYIEQRRSRILEDINGARPLAEIVEQITELVSFKLHGAPCWCQVADGPKLGNCPAKLAGLRIAQLDIPARSGPPLGTVFAAFDRLTTPSANETQTLSMAVGLTELAIETRRFYTDLVHRSEFDLLTDIHNRFSLKKHLDRQIRDARETASIFGLIYIDLDRFKQVNDTCGHHVGDLYLQEAAIRMKRQLRPHDKLARLGGDEFAALVPVVRGRADVEEIARRLERCFDDPFVLEGYTLHGAASVGIALFPEDATTVDALLSAADAAMYAAKYAKRNIEDAIAGQGPKFSPLDAK
jgi:diguanylate cyclase (GGDEF)-like protein